MRDDRDPEVALDEQRPMPVRIRPRPVKPDDRLPIAPSVPGLGVAPAVVRVAAVSGWRAVSWSVGASLAGTRTVLRRATSGDPPAAVIANLAADARGAAWRALGLGEEDTDERGVPESVGPLGATSDDLRERGAELLRQSNDVRLTEETHPAYARILAEITPDEARILRYLYLHGPQPSIDVRTNRPFGIGSELVVGGLNMIAEHAGCKHLDRIHPYLTNLFRLGMVEFSKEQVSNPQRYQLIEAQPKVSEAIKRAGRWPRTVHRSIHLNSFGEDFCAACLPATGPL